VFLKSIIVYCILQPIDGVLSDAELIRRFIDRWHNLDNRVRNVKWMHSTGTHTSICQQLLGTNILRSLHSLTIRRGGILRSQIIARLLKMIFGLSLKSLWNPQRKKGCSLMVNRTIQKRHFSQSYLGTVATLALGLSPILRKRFTLSL